MRKTATLALLLLISGGCGGEPPPWAGTYTASGTWKLSGPFAGGRTVGDAAADFLIEKIAGFAPVPSFLEDDLSDWLAGAIREEVKTTVDANMPKDLAPDGALTKLLAETLATIKVESTIVLEQGDDDDELQGNESVTALEYVIRGQKHRISVSQLSGNTGAGIVAQWAGKEPGSGQLSIDPHSVGIRYGELVRLIATDLLQASELTAINTQLASAFSCKAIVAAILQGKPGLEISIVGWSHTISTGDLEGLCASAMSVMESRVLGQLELDTHVEVGGSVTWTRLASPQSIELRSGSDFGGVVNILSRAISPRVGVTFTAQR
jgi:hypothetical protein